MLEAGPNYLWPWAAELHGVHEQLFLPLNEPASRAVFCAQEHHSPPPPTPQASRASLPPFLPVPADGCSMCTGSQCGRPTQHLCYPSMATAASLLRARPCLHLCMHASRTRGFMVAAVQAHRPPCGPCCCAGGVLMCVCVFLCICVCVCVSVCDVFL